MRNEKGQALITLLVFTIMAITITSAAVVVIIINSTTATKLQESTVAYEVAESGANNAVLRLLRDPGYTGEALTVGNGTATITVVPTGGLYVIMSQGKENNFIRTVQVNASYFNNVLVATSAGEVF